MQTLSNKNYKNNCMKTEIQSILFNSKQELKSFICIKVNSLVRFYKEVIGSEIVLRLDNSHTRENKICQVRLVIPGYDLWASARSNTFEEATLKVVKALKRQIQNHKAKSINHKRNIVELINFQ